VSGRIGYCFRTDLHFADVNHTINNACTDVFHYLGADSHSSSPEVEDIKIDTLRSKICGRIHLTGTDPLMAQPHNEQCRFDENFLDYVLEELIEQPNHSFNHLSSFVTATQAAMRFSAVLPMGGSAIGSSSQPISCSNSNSNSNCITNITNMTSVGNTGLGDESPIVDCAMSLQG